MSVDRPSDSEADVGDTSDRRLLDQFIRYRDEAAFRELVVRHGTLVMGVCRRVLRDEHEVDDAFQATFSVLAHGARRIRNRGNVAAWLYGTAYRIARKMREKRYRRREAPLVGELCVDGDALAALAERCDREALDEELNRLPPRYREPLVLHYLHKRTTRQVAEELGLSIRAVEGRLRRGRNELRYRLARRGVSLAVVASAIESLHTANVTAASMLVDSTVEVGLAYASGKVTSNAAGFAAEELSKMRPIGTTTSLVATIAAVALLVGGTGSFELPSTAARELRMLHFGVAPHPAEGSDDRGTFVMADAADTGEQAAESQGVASDAVTRPAEPVANGQPGRIYLAAHLRIPQVDESDRVLGVIGVDPQTGEWEVVSGSHPTSLKVAPDGKSVLMSLYDRTSRENRLVLFDLQEKTSKDLGEFWSAILSRDGKAAIVTQVEFPESGGRSGLVLASGSRHWRLDLATLEKTPLPIPGDRIVLDASPDLELCLTLRKVIRPGEPKPFIQQLILSRSDGAEERPLIDEDAASHAFACFAPNGDTVAFVSHAPGQPSRIRVIDLNGQDDRILFEAEGSDHVLESLCWSPDGQHLLAIVREPEGAESNLRLITVDAQTRAHREITLANAEVISLRYANWR